jgi:hypothetical protein
MSKNPKRDQPEENWAGLAQNLFGLSLEKANNEDDLLDEDLFKIELPKPAVVEVVTETASSAPTAVPGLPVEATPEPILASPVALAAPTAAAKPVVRKTAPASDSDDEPFGAGLIDEIENSEPESVSAVVSETVVEFAVGVPAAPNAVEIVGSDPEGLTLPEDFDDGLTLPPETVAADLAEDKPADDTEVARSDRVDDRPGVRAERPRRRHPRRSREDAYWDMLENWEWEEIPPSDSDSEEGDRPRGSRGERDRSGRSDRGRRGRRRDQDVRSDVRSDDRESSSADAGLRREPAAVPSERSSQRDRGDRLEHGSSDRGRRSERSDRVSPDQPRHESRTHSNPQRQPGLSKPAMPSAPLADDFGAGIFDEPTTQFEATSPSTACERTVVPNEDIAQSSQAGDKLLFDNDRAASPIDDDLVWEDSDSDVTPAELGRVPDPAALPAADNAGESDQVFDSSDVTPLEDSDDLPRSRRRRRRRGGQRDPRDPTETQRGSTFDLSEALSASEGDTPDFIPSASAEDRSLDEESTATEPVDGSTEERRSDRRGGRRRRRRVRGDTPPDQVDAAGAVIESDATVETRASVEEITIKPTVYSNIPTWEETIRYLLQPHLVGRNLGPEDAADNLEGDPRGSGGAEPTPPPPRRRGGRGRGRRP